MQVYPMKPEEFAAILVEKLELVKHEQDAQEKLDRKLQEVCAGMFHMAGGSVLCNFVVNWHLWNAVAWNNF
jgi:hypothetical protein